MTLMTLIFFLYTRGISINSSVIRLSGDIAAESSPKAMFRKFMIANHRNYANDEEKAKRFAIFVENLTYIASLNAIYNDSVFGITKFADYTSEELQKVAMKVPPHYDDEQIINYAEEVGLSIPGFFDWRKKSKVTAVKDQGECNSCWAFASVAVIESLHAIKSDELIDLSEQQLIECDPNSDGCIFGYPSTAYLVGKRRGLLTEPQFSYRGVKEGACPSESGKIFVKLIQKIKPNADAIADYVYNFGPVSVNLRLTKPLYHYTTGIFHPSESECESSNNYHVWTIVGFGESASEQYWIIKNSWGMNWGDEGFIYFVRGKNACGIESYPYSATI